MSYVIGVDLGTSAVKVLLVDKSGKVVQTSSKPYPLIQEKAGYSEQDPEQWVKQTVAALRELMSVSGAAPEQVEGISFSGQMHGLVLLNEQHQVIRNAILWNDTRTTPQCREIEQKLGDSLLDITKNVALEGFTLPKILWVKENEPDNFAAARVFLLPKDYLRFRLTGTLHMDVSDAAGTLLLDVLGKTWSGEICRAFGIDPAICPPLAESFDFVGELLPEAAEQSGLLPSTKVFAGGADNACGAVGSGIVSPGVTLCSIGTSGVILSYEENKNRDFRGSVHFFNHAEKDAYYVMGVTLAAGYSLSWFKDTFAAGESFEQLLEGIEQVPVGSKGLLFTPYIVGERTPHPDSVIRASFIGISSQHTRIDFARAVLEGITFSLNESLELFRKAGKQVDKIVSIGGGAQNETWLQMQADIFNATVVKMDSEQGPGMGAAMLAAYGCGWFASLAECAEAFIHFTKEFKPDAERANAYRRLFEVYKQVYAQTKALNEQLQPFRD